MEQAVGVVEDGVLGDGGVLVVDAKLAQGGVADVVEALHVVRQARQLVLDAVGCLTAASRVVSGDWRRGALVAGAARRLMAASFAVSGGLAVPALVLGAARRVVAVSWEALAESNEVQVWH